MRRDFSKSQSSIDDLFAFVDAFVRTEGIDEANAFQLTMVTEELYTNLVKYNKGGRGLVTIQLERIGEWIELELTDYDVAPFDITTAELPNLDVPIEQRRAGGMGLHLVKSFADELRYRHEGGHSTITFRKRIA